MEKRVGCCMAILAQKAFTRENLVHLAAVRYITDILINGLRA